MIESAIGNPSKGGVNQGVDARADLKAWFAKLDEYLDEPFFPEGRLQPANPARRDLLLE